LLAVSRVTHPLQVEEGLRKDSLDLTEEERARVVDHVRRARVSRRVITHGTDTMALTAGALAEISHKTIVLTGAIAPARLSERDAAFNLGMPFATAKLTGCAAWPVAGLDQLVTQRLAAGSLSLRRPLTSGVAFDQSDDTPNR